MKTEVKAGRYRHFKGQYYEVIGVVTHSETEEKMVLYKALYGKQGLWVRPLVLFFSSVMVDGEQIPRFEYLGDK
ncbi:DUF1653 domain-containing protein [Endozoicomonas sp. SM1973]|uniref:DUF1653 domain-containing protein n=1 Tax=Spartinivicinus marinus TaxID=2994442 RepID=A0A853IDS0_9GAMM|nr:DUF1653 domain-containing protein [Spartinivicinus marinus]NYZ68071.1 DUF1653 domain-containing protein [Spartinivicinus marinus]